MRQLESTTRNSFVSRFIISFSDILFTNKKRKHKLNQVITSFEIGLLCR